MDPEAIRNKLRETQPGNLEKRRKIIGLAAVGLLDFSVLSLYQTGIIKRLPDIPLPFFGANKVSSSKEAYLLGVPDGPVASTLYSLVMAFAAAGGSRRTGRSSIFDKLLKGVVSANAAAALLYFYAMIKNRRICLYCFTGAVINLASAFILFTPQNQRS